MTREHERTAWLTRLLLAANIAVFGYQLYLFSQGGTELVQRFVDQYAVQYGHTISNEAYETLVTSAFIHGGTAHLLINMIALYLFGKASERAFGAVATLVLYLVSTVAGSALFLALRPEMTVPSVGASGAIFGLIGALILGAPEHPVIRNVPLLHYFSLPLLRNVFSTVVLGGLFFALPELLTAVGVIEPMERVNNLAHLGGLVSGAALAWLFRPRKAKKGLFVFVAFTGLVLGYYYVIIEQGYSEVEIYFLGGGLLLLTLLRVLVRTPYER